MLHARVTTDRTQARVSARSRSGLDRMMVRTLRGDALTVEGPESTARAWHEPCTGSWLVLLGTGCAVVPADRVPEDLSALRATLRLQTPWDTVPVLAPLGCWLDTGSAAGAIWGATTTGALPEGWGSVPTAPWPIPAPWRATLVDSLTESGIHGGDPIRMATPDGDTGVVRTVAGVLQGLERLESGAVMTLEAPDVRVRGRRPGPVRILRSAAEPLLHLVTCAGQAALTQGCPAPGQPLIDADGWTTWPCMVTVLPAEIGLGDQPVALPDAAWMPADQAAQAARLMALGGLLVTPPRVTAMRIDPIDA
jgi:hypothetical protein